MTVETPERALENLLRELLSVEQLRRWLRGLPGGEALVDELPSAPASSAEVIHQAVLELKRAGMVDQEFFDALIAERPKQAARIQEVAVRWSGAPAPITAASEGQPAERERRSQTVVNHGPVAQQINIHGGSHVFNVGKGHG